MRKGLAFISVISDGIFSYPPSRGVAVAVAAAAGVMGGWAVPYR